MGKCTSIEKKRPNLDQPPRKAGDVIRAKLKAFFHRQNMTYGEVDPHSIRETHEVYSSSKSALSSLMATITRDIENNTPLPFYEISVHRIYCYHEKDRWDRCIYDNFLTLSKPVEQHTAREQAFYRAWCDFLAWCEAEEIKPVFTPDRPLPNDMTEDQRTETKQAFFDTRPDVFLLWLFPKDMPDRTWG